MDRLLRAVSKKSLRKLLFKKVVTFLKDSGLRTMQADKKDGFVVMRSGMFDEKATKAVKKHFMQVDVCSAKQKEVALMPLREALSKSFKKTEVNHMEVFLTGTTHKPECPIRVIVSVKGTWQKVIVS